MRKVHAFISCDDSVFDGSIAGETTIVWYVTPSEAQSGSMSWEAR